MRTSYVNGPQGYRRPVPGAPTDAQLGLSQPLRASVSVNFDVVKMACPHLRRAVQGCTKRHFQGCLKVG